MYVCQEGTADQTNTPHFYVQTAVLFLTWSPVSLVEDPHVLFPNKQKHIILHRLDSTDLAPCTYIQRKAS